ncbi:hypothetical protein [Falsiroseomonas sp. HW251]|uniref:hypothetical protein n=1 Tax=Falsiroseomonas sp. HW251 TaxID=3390998 RepID=UPI003D31DB50
MSDGDGSCAITLLDALVDWSDPDLVEAVRRCERTHTADEMSCFTGPRLVPNSELRRPLEKEWMLGGSDYTLIVGAWRRLYADFVHRLTRGQFYLSGVQTRPVLTTTPTHIPGAWAAECEFDFVRNVATVGDVRFAAVTASRSALSNSGAGERNDPRPAETQSMLSGPDVDPCGTPLNVKQRGRASFSPAIKQAVRGH